MTDPIIQSLKDLLRTIDESYERMLGDGEMHSSAVATSLYILRGMILRSFDKNGIDLRAEEGGHDA